MNVVWSASCKDTMFSTKSRRNFDTTMLKTRFKFPVCLIRSMIPVALFCAVILFSDAEANPGKVTVERDWIDQATVLVERAATGWADGKRYTEDVKAHRADLRELMRSSGTDLAQAHRQLHMSMVLLGILLKTAAGCQTGGHVVCPPSLMIQLRAVLKNTYINLETYEGRHLAAGKRGAMQ